MDKEERSFRVHHFGDFPYRNIHVSRLYTYYKKVSEILDAASAEDKRLEREWMSPEGNDYRTSEIWHKSVNLKYSIARRIKRLTNNADCVV